MFEPLTLSPKTKSQFVGLAAAALLILNLLDGIFTIVWVLLGVAEEANPLMASFLGNGPVPFMVAKLILVSSGVGLLWYLREHRGASAALYGGTAVYSMLLVYHLSSIQGVNAFLAAQ